VIPSWSSTGDGVRNPDLVAPGAGVVGLRDPGSFLDTSYPAARIGTRFFRGSGTSQAAAVVSGAAALLLSADPELTNDQVKTLLTGSARHVPSANPRGQGRGELNLGAALSARLPSAAAATQRWARATGTGSLEASRGSTHIYVGGAELSGETDVTGAAWDGATWAAAAATGGDWAGDAWNGQPWLGHGWNADHWAGQSWNGTGWTGVLWLPDASGNYTARMWAGQAWTSRMWASNDWNASMWAASMWAASMWAAAMWG
jgi:serine protease AprX